MKHKLIDYQYSTGDMYFLITGWYAIMHGTPKRDQDIKDEMYIRLGKWRNST